MSTPHINALEDEDPLNWSVEAVASWAQTHNFSDIISVFKANDVDGYVLLNHLNHTSLKDELKIESFGRRARILDEIKSLRQRNNITTDNGYGGTSHQSAPAPPAPPAPPTLLQTPLQTPLQPPSSSNQRDHVRPPLWKNRDESSTQIETTPRRLEQHAGGAVVLSDDDAQMLDDVREDVGEYDNDGDTKSGGSGDESLGNDDSETDEEDNEDAYEQEKGDVDSVPATISSTIRALVGLSPATSRGVTAPSSSSLLQVNILQPRRKGELKPVLAEVTTVGGNTVGVDSPINGMAASTNEPQLSSPAPFTAITMPKVNQSVQPASASSQAVVLGINILQPRRKGDPRPTDIDSLALPTPVSIPNIPVSSLGSSLVPTAAHITSPRPPPLSPCPPPSLPFHTLQIKSRSPPSKPHKPRQQQLWQKRYLPSRGVPESALFFSTDPTHTDEFGPEPDDDSTENPTTLLVCRRAKFYAGRIPYLGEHRVVQRRMKTFLFQPAPVVWIEESGGMTMVYKPLRTHAEKLQARRGRRVNPDVIGTGLAKERTWVGGWKWMDDDVPVVVLKVERKEGEEREIFAVIRTTWSKVKPGVVEDEYEEPQGVSATLFADEMLNRLEKRWTRAGADEEYAEGAGLRLDAEGFTEIKPPSDPKDLYYDELPDDFVRELEMEEEQERRSKMSLEERMLEKERLAKAAGKAKLTREEVKEEIDQWTREFEEKWADKKLVKFERKKYHVWIHERIEDVEAQLKDVSNRRFPKLVDELLTMNFFTTKEIRHMCASLEETIVLRFELGWKVSVLNGEKPEKPPRRKKTDGHDTRRKEKMKVTEANDEVEYSGSESNHDEDDYTTESSANDIIDDSEMITDDEPIQTEFDGAPREAYDESEEEIQSKRKRYAPNWSKEQRARLKEMKVSEAAEMAAALALGPVSSDGRDDNGTVKEGIVEQNDEDVVMFDVDAVRESEDGPDTRTKIQHGNEINHTGLSAIEGTADTTSTDPTQTDGIKTVLPPPSTKEDAQFSIVDVGDDVLEMEETLESGVTFSRENYLAAESTPTKNKGKQRATTTPISSSPRLSGDIFQERALANRKRFMEGNAKKGGWRHVDDDDQDYSNDDAKNDNLNDDILITEPETTRRRFGPSDPMAAATLSQRGSPLIKAGVASSIGVGTDRSPIMLLSDEETGEVERPVPDMSKRSPPKTQKTSQQPENDLDHLSVTKADQVKDLIKTRKAAELYSMMRVAMRARANDPKASFCSGHQTLRRLFISFRWWATQNSAKENQIPARGTQSIAELLSLQRFQTFCRLQRRNYTGAIDEEQSGRLPGIAHSRLAKGKRTLRSADKGGADDVSGDSDSDDLGVHGIGKTLRSKRHRGEDLDNGEGTSAARADHWWKNSNGKRSTNIPKKRLATASDDDIIILTGDERPRRQRKKFGKIYHSDNDSTDDDHRNSRPRFRQIQPQEKDVAASWAKLKKKNKEVEQRAKKQQEQREWGEKDHVIINIGHAELEDDIKIIPELGSKLKEHQKDGVQFLWKQIVMFRDYGCILAHNMGLGKTLQVIVFIFTLMREITNGNSSIPEHLKPGRTLILAPATVTQNWINEIEYWIPKEYASVMKNTFQFTKANFSLQERLKVVQEWFDGGGTLILGYEAYRELVVGKSVARQSEEENRLIEKYLVNPGPSLVIADEGHRIKNSSSALSLTLRKINTLSRVCLTGYPLQNNLEEYWTMIDWVRPQYLGELSSFRNQFKNPIEKVYADSTASEIKISHRQLYILKSAIGDLIQRKDATTLRRELQKKTEFVLAVRLTSLQQEFTLRYLATCQHNSDMTSGFLVKVNHLRSIANHPHIFQSYVFPEKKRKSTGSAISSIAGNGETANDPVEVDGELFEAAQVTPGEETALKALMQSLSANVQDMTSLHHSNKFCLVMDILIQCKKIGDKVLIFSHQIPLLDYMQQQLSITNITCMRLDGNTAQQKRQSLIDSFNNDPSQDVFLVSSKAGSLGVNLVAANRVILFDVDWNPCHDDQAIARAYRYGQKKQVFVYRFQSYSTIEERIFQNNVQKMGLSFRVIDGVQKNREFTKAEISKYLSNPEQDPLSRLEDLTEDTKKEIAADPVINEAINKNRDKIIDVRQVNSYLLDHLDVDGALTQQELEECQQEVLKYTQGSSAVAPVVVAPVVVAPVVVTQMAVESVGSAGTDSLPETPFLTYFETVAPELRPMTL